MAKIANQILSPGQEITSGTPPCRLPRKCNRTSTFYSETRPRTVPGAAQTAARRTSASR